MKKIDMIKVLDISMKIEESGKNLYMKTSERMKEDHLKCFFLQVSVEEKVHYEFFQRLKEELISNRGNMTEKIISENDLALTKNSEETQDFVFNRYDIITKIIKTKNFEEVLTVMMEIENCTVEYFTKLSPFIDRNESSVIATVINQERLHYKKFSELKSKLKMVA